MHAVLARSQVRQLGGSGEVSRYRFVDFEVPDTTTRELVEAGKPETFARRPLLALRGGG